MEKQVFRSQKLREIRRKQGLTLQDLSAKSSVSFSVISAYEIGAIANHSIEIVRRLEKALRVKKGILFQ